MESIKNDESDISIPLLINCSSVLGRLLGTDTIACQAPLGSKNEDRPDDLDFRHLRKAFNIDGRQDLIRTVCSAKKVFMLKKLK